MLQNERARTNEGITADSPAWTASYYQELEEMIDVVRREEAELKQGGAPQKGRWYEWVLWWLYKWATAVRWSKKALDTREN